MGNFLSLSSIIGKTKNEVVNSLTNYANSVSGGLQQESNINSDTDNCCIIDEENGNVSILYPNGYVEWDESSSYISNEEIESWKGNANTLAQYSININKADIEKYLVRWDLESENLEKAYPTDEFEQGEWQLTDFMNKLKLPYPLDDNGNPKGLTFKLWTKQLKLETVNTKNRKTETKREKPWWKFW